MKIFKPIPILGDYIDGNFVLSKDPSGEIESMNPGNTKDHLGMFPYTYSHVGQAVDAAKKAFLTWRNLTIDQRISYFKKLHTEISSQVDALSEVISRETGKPLWEARQEAQALLGKITVTIESSMKLVMDHSVADALADIPGRYRFKPRGVMAVIGPFNFPAHLPHGHIVPALLTGNTVVFKPSELTPAVGQVYAEIFHKAGFPKGVFNLVQGEKEIGKRLCMEKNVDGILFTGSYEVGLKIKQETAQHYWKLVALEMGGKNAAIVLEDAPFQKTLYEVVKGAYLTTGQRCSATSRLILLPKIADQFIEKLHQLSKEIRIGYAFEDEPPFMGPLIHQTAMEKYLRFQGIAQREGGETIMRGKALELKYPGYYVTPSIYRMFKNQTGGTYLQSEIFGPSLGILIADSLEEAISLSNQTDYGLVTSVFTKDRASYETVFQNSKTGLINWNRSTVGASSKLPFGGMGKSGNGYPTALFAPYYCTYPVASLEDEADDTAPSFLPGIPKYEK
ncbi:MAG: N-succinylglutamate 5-semialdehyde dehydrogenase [Deltaproteobacteria bacterium RIFCSPHIGHO2_02_FULL_40_11]|nr:MAG: N-succinylglutamate 5-semialdehyde dehydrogenase [Deltaproteobacteria bacterium RIFCSPHIGHO2_02_FULL_40_11]